ncbi:MAG: endo-1,4-beta-xylanase [Duganella sp.]
MIRRVALTMLLGTAAPQAAGQDLPSLAKAYEGRLKIGAAVEPSQLASAEAPLLAAHFNSIVAENVMKPADIQPKEGAYNFAPADKLVAYAHGQGMAMRGHTLLWHLRTPEWMWTDSDGKPATRGLVLARLKSHIETVVGRYKGAVYAWDVVNEVIDDKQPNCLRKDKWFAAVGDDYIEQAFRYAHAADPKARLYINDYSTEEPAKRQCLERVVKGLIARGVPVHGVGHQMHVSVFGPSVQAIDESLSTFARLGLENQVTELDVSLYRYQAKSLSDSEEKLQQLQGERYAALMKVFLAHPELRAVTLWGISDSHTWLNHGEYAGRHDAPLPFDRRQQPKPAYTGMLNAAKNSAN